MATSPAPPRCLSDREANIEKGWKQRLPAKERLRARLEVRKAIQAAEPAMAPIVLGDSPYLCALRGRRSVLRDRGSVAAACRANAVLVIMINVGMFCVQAPSKYRRSPRDIQSYAMQSCEKRNKETF